MAGTGSGFPPAAAVVPLMALFLTLPSTCNPVDTPPPPSTGDTTVGHSGGEAPRPSSGGGGPGTPGRPPAPAPNPVSTVTGPTTTAVATTSPSATTPSRMIHYRRYQRPQRRDAPHEAPLEDEYEVKPECADFVTDQPQPGGSFIFTSPSYPSHYPNNIDCVRKIEAEPGQVLKLDFRDEFHIEEADDCRFDYLEIRDGAYGYSSLVTKPFCGRQFPDIIQSTGRFLWLRFHTDDNIEYKGFQAIYFSVPRGTDPDHKKELEPCKFLITGESDGYINSTDIAQETRDEFQNNNTPLDCLWTIQVDLGWKINLVIDDFKLAKPNDCDENFVDIFNTSTDMRSRIRNFCGSIADVVQSPTNILHLRFYAATSANGSSFKSTFTAFREVPDGNCGDNEVNCEDNTCINMSLNCNGRKNCRFGGDEADERCKGSSSEFLILMGSDRIVIIMVIFTLILSGMCFAFVFNCVRKLRRDHRIIQEHIRQSREGRLDDVGRTSPSMDHVMTTTAFDGDLSLGGDGSLDESPVAARSRSRSRPRDCCVPVGYGLTEWSPGGNMGDDTVHPILTPSAPNGDAAFIRNEAAACTLSAATRNSVIGGSSNLVSACSIPEMRDSECQTRESLFQFQNNSGSGKNSQERSVTPPPPPPPSLAKLVNMKNSRNAPAFSTFGYSGTPPVSNRGTAATLPSRRPEDTRCFRAEAVIEMDAKNGSSSSTQTGADGSNNASGARPYSVESSKSAPDVIVTH